MSIDIEFNDFLINEKQAEIFAYNIYRDIEEHIKENFEDFFVWNLETISINCIMTLDGIATRELNYKYDLCKYNNNR